MSEEISQVDKRFCIVDIERAMYKAKISDKLKSDMLEALIPEPVKLIEKGELFRVLGGSFNDDLMLHDHVDQGNGMRCGLQIQDGGVCPSNYYWNGLSFEVYRDGAWVAVSGFVGDIS